MLFIVCIRLSGHPQKVQHAKHRFRFAIQNEKKATCVELCYSFVKTFVAGPTKKGLLTHSKSIQKGKDGEKDGSE